MVTVKCNRTNVTTVEDCQENSKGTPMAITKGKTWIVVTRGTRMASAPIPCWKMKYNRKGHGKDGKRI